MTRKINGFVTFQSNELAGFGSIIVLSRDEAARFAAFVVITLNNDVHIIDRNGNFFKEEFRNVQSYLGHERRSTESTVTPRYWNTSLNLLGKCVSMDLVGFQTDARPRFRCRRCPRPLQFQVNLTGRQGERKKKRQTSTSACALLRADKDRTRQPSTPISTIT